MSHGEVVEHVSRRYRLERTQGRSIAFWGVIMLSITEGMLFAVLLFSYFYLWARSPEWPQGGAELPALGFVWVRTAILLGSSGTIWSAERALKRGDRRRVWWWTIATVAAAAFFLVTHVVEFVHLTEEFTWSDHAYGSLWWTILNVHGAHVLVGILIFGFVLVRLGRGAYGPHDHTQFETASIYWHFVDGIWVFVFTSLYLLPNWLAGGS